MLELSPEDILLTAKAANKKEALAIVAESMKSGGLITADYLKGMEQRETQTSTFLGHGIAIPHGTNESRQFIKKTGLKIVRFPDGVDWGDGNIVKTAIGIAAKSDEHLEILRKLTRVISNEELAQRLHTCTDPQEVIRILNGLEDEPLFLIDPKAIRLHMNLEDVSEAQAITGIILIKHGCLMSSELTGFQSQKAIPFSNGLWLLTMKTGSGKSGLSIVSNSDSQKPWVFIAITTGGSQHKAVFDRLLQMKSDDQLSQLILAKSSEGLAALLKMPAIKGVSREVRLSINQGLHARPASELAKIIKSFERDVWISNLDGDGVAVLGNSVTRLLNLGASYGHRLRFTIEQKDDSEKILASLVEEVRKGLGDKPQPLAEPSEAMQGQDLTPQKTAKLAAGATITGVKGSPGIAVGEVRIKSRTKFSYEESSKDTQNELSRFAAKIEDLAQGLADKIEQSQDITKTKILSVHQELLQDPELIDHTKDLIRTGKTAEWAWVTTCDQQVKNLRNQQNPLLAERADDILDLSYQLMLLLTGQSIKQSHKPHILISESIEPSQVADFDPAIVKAIVCSTGGATSHAAILARSAGIPMLLSTGPEVLSIADGTTVIVDCDSKTLTVAPEAEIIAQAEEDILKRQKLTEVAMASRLEPAITTDGIAVEILANISSADDVADALAQGAEGIGLYRSEFLYMSHSSEPNQEQQVSEYKRVYTELGEKERPLIVRTLDIGGDKPLPYLSMDQEENPFLGVRGARLSLLHPELLYRQLKALMEASKGHTLRIMFPMVGDISEWRRIRKIYTEVASQYPTVSVELGIMIEVPSAALMADKLAAELDFFSIGTNDLTQYTLAIDRGHPKLSADADSIHPAVLRLIAQTTEAAHKAGIWVGVCGELAADPFGAVLLMGLGVTELSMSASAIPLVKAKIRSVSLETSKSLAQRALQQENAIAVRKLHEEDS